MVGVEGGDGGSSVLLQRKFAVVTVDCWEFCPSCRISVVDWKSGDNLALGVIHSLSLRLHRAYRMLNS
jgi:hypothetical protein